MTQPGYRKTSPPRVFVDFSREAVEAIGENNFSLYKDPLDLKNTLKSFSYTLTKGDVPGRMDLQLINPSQQVEEKLFAWFAAINPRSWRAKQDAPNPEGAKEYWAKVALEAVKFFVRWGYISDPEDSSSPVAALSHIHEMLVFDVGYEISDKQDRIVTLQMQTQHDISLMRQADQAGKSLNQTIKTKIVDENGLREPAEIVSDIIARLSSGGGTVGGCFLSDEQRQMINDKFDVLGTRNLPGPEDIDFLANSEFDSETESGRLMGYNTVMRFFNGLGVDAHIDIGGDPSPAPERTVSPAQVPELPPVDVSDNAVDQFVDEAQNAFTYALDVTTSAVDQEFKWEENTLVPGVIGDAILINPFNPLEPEIGVITLPSFGDALRAQPSEPLYSRYFSYEQLQQCIEQDVIYLLPKAREASYGISDQGFADTENLTPAGRLAVSEYIPVDIELTEASLEYKISEHPEIEAAINFMILKHQQEVLDINREQELEQIQQDLQDDRQVLEENPIATSDPVPQEFDGSYISFTTPHRDLTLKKFLDRLNTTFFENTSDYIQCTHVPTSVIDAKDRKTFETRFAGASIDWDKETGVTLVGTIGFQNRLLSFLGKINSFDIQIPDKPERIILSTGFSKNKTNIITDLSYRQSKAGWFFEFLQSPIIMQQVYSIAERFETTEYRDVVWRFIELQLDPNAEASIVRVFPGGDTQMEKSAKGFPVDLGNKAFAAAARSLTDADYVEDLAGGDLEKAKLIKQVAEDLHFLKENELIEAFFPKASKDMLGSEGARAFIGVENRNPVTLTGYEDSDGTPSPSPVGLSVEEATQSFDGEGALATELLDQKTYRFMANSPLLLLKAGQEREASMDETFGPTLLAQRMRVLQAFKKRIMNIRLRTLGIPEMDVFSYEINQRKVGLIVSEPRVPGTYHWITGMYYPIDVTHKISPADGYTTEIELLVSDSNTQEEMLEVSFTFLEGSNA
jgi:hypothetical protein